MPEHRAEEDTRVLSITSIALSFCAGFCALGRRGRRFRYGRLLGGLNAMGIFHGGIPLNESTLRTAIARLGSALVDQRRARCIIEPHADSSGYWFGGGNLCPLPDGGLLLVGRYRNAGDSTFGLAKGERGAELALFRSDDGGASFSKILSFSKADLAVGGHEVLSIEGAAIAYSSEGFELFVSTEKAGIDYPEGFEAFKKPGTGLWSIDRMAAADLAALGKAKPEAVELRGDPGRLHLKDPCFFRAGDGSTVLIFCSHPFGWSSSNSAYAIRPAGDKCFGDAVHDFFPRGTAWDVAATRVTDVLSLPGGLFGETRSVNLVFYDGAECMRRLEESPNAVRRPRGYSCEELAGLAYFIGDEFSKPIRLSPFEPLFVSPWGTGCSRYIHACADAFGIHAAWQQGRSSGAQPLVMNSLSWEEVSGILGQIPREGH